MSDNEVDETIIMQSIINQMRWWPLLLLVATLCSCKMGKSSDQTSASISKEIHDNRLDQARFLSDPVYRIEYETKMSSLRWNLAKAYNTELNPDFAIDILQDLIEGIQRDKELSQRSGHLMLQAYYYRDLARSFEIKGDKDRQRKALEKAARLEKQSQMRKQKEQAHEKAQKETRINAILK